MSTAPYDPQRPHPGRRSREVLRRATELRGRARSLLADHEQARNAVEQAVGPVRDALVGAALESMPVAELARTTSGQLRVDALEQAGLGSVGAVLRTSPEALRRLPGVSRLSADQALAAAQQLAEAAGHAISVTLDVDRQDAPSTALVLALNRLVVAGPDADRAREAATRLDRAITALLAEAAPARSRLRHTLAGSRRRTPALTAVAALHTLLAEAAADELPLLFSQAGVDLLRPSPSPAEAWIDFELRAADHYSVLDRIGGPDPDPEAATGHLPSDLVGRISGQELDRSQLRVSLRGYQAFGARFALARRRVILGDEMGLGKTVQAIAAMAHLRARGGTHFLVVCPTGVMVNWMRELERRSVLPAVRVYGDDRQDALRAWQQHGGVAVTSYGMLRSLPRPERTAALAMLVVDEAHLVKNPKTQRSQQVAEWAAGAERVLFLTGTAMENRVGEFTSLVAQLGVPPELLRDIGAVARADDFRKAVAPVYLRRNQQDVLAELPGTVRTDEWAEFSADDLSAYRAAVESRNFMAMRRAAYRHPEQSAKLVRLRELVAEAAADGLKVIVFSSFHDVLAAVGTALRDQGTPFFGPLDGSTPALDRQRLVDDFGAAPGHAVMVSQIQVGGLGLNIQAASVVILCEPQIKPSLESQAVGRVHRMGQVRRVRVHRLLAADSMDQRLVELLNRKERAFDAYARRSELAETEPEALDISEESLARQLVEDELLRLAAPA
ncbi:DEAD/DEAH box helicase [Streptacidiphilus sp. N1-3]|uniref:DEAD/DEAH box helicase n=1 Tax=Streptacidiphilus alkalitolerans TaxID=3342712 RepID=A0ABV6WWN8_9ACTN